MKLHSIIHGMVLAAVVLIAAHAFAQPVNLVCTRVDYKDIVHRITFDESLGTAFFGDDQASQASFTATNIKWSGKYDQSSPTAAFKLDRISGVLDISFFNGHLPFVYNCVVAAEKKF
jgi:hypothetical protein